MPVRAVNRVRGETWFKGWDRHSSTAGKVARPAPREGAFTVESWPSWFFDISCISTPRFRVAAASGVVSQRLFRMEKTAPVQHVPRKHKSSCAQPPAQKGLLGKDFRKQAATQVPMQRAKALHATPSAMSRNDREFYGSQARRFAKRRTSGEPSGDKRYERRGAIVERTHLRHDGGCRRKPARKCRPANGLRPGASAEAGCNTAKGVQQYLEDPGVGWASGIPPRASPGYRNVRSSEAKRTGTLCTEDSANEPVALSARPLPFSDPRPPARCGSPCRLGPSPNQDSARAVYSVRKPSRRNQRMSLQANAV